LLFDFCAWFFVIASHTFHHCGVVFFFLALHLNLLSMNSLLLRPPLQVFSFPILWLSLGFFCFPSCLNHLCVVFLLLQVTCSIIVGLQPSSLVFFGVLFCF
jgi:uncharacterized membrane protein YvlD (DUF360 family)